MDRRVGALWSGWLERNGLGGEPIASYERFRGRCKRLQHGLERQSVVTVFFCFSILRNRLLDGKFLDGEPRRISFETKKCVVYRQELQSGVDIRFLERNCMPCTIAAKGKLITIKDHISDFVRIWHLSPPSAANFIPKKNYCQPIASRTSRSRRRPSARMSPTQKRSKAIRFCTRP